MPEMKLTDADRIAEELEKHRNRLLRDFVMLDKLYDSVLEQYRELTVLTEAETGFCCRCTPVFERLPAHARENSRYLCAHGGKRFHDGRAYR